MLRVDHMRKHVYDCRALASSRVASRCPEISLDAATGFFKMGYRLFDLSEFCILDTDKVIVRKWGFRTKALAEFQCSEDDRVCQTIDVITYLP